MIRSLLAAPCFALGLLVAVGCFSGDDSGEKEAAIVVEVLVAYQELNVSTFRFNDRLNEAAAVCLSLDDKAEKLRCATEGSPGFVEAWDYLVRTVEANADRIPVPDEQSVALRRLAYDYINGLKKVFNSSHNGLRVRTDEEGDELSRTAQETRFAASVLQARCKALDSSPPDICLADLDREAERIADRPEGK